MAKLRLDTDRSGNGVLTSDVQSRVCVPSSPLCRFLGILIRWLWNSGYSHRVLLALVPRKAFNRTGFVQYELRSTVSSASHPSVNYILMI